AAPPASSRPFPQPDPLPRLLSWELSSVKLAQVSEPFGHSRLLNVEPLALYRCQEKGKRCSQQNKVLKKELARCCRDRRKTARRRFCHAGGAQEEGERNKPGDLVIVTIPERNVPTLPKGCSPACQQAWSSWIPATTIRASAMAGLQKSSRECRKAAGSNRNWDGPLSRRLITSMRAICSNAVGLVDRLGEFPCLLRGTMQRP